MLVPLEKPNNDIRFADQLPINPEVLQSNGIVKSSLEKANGFIVLIKNASVALENAQKSGDEAKALRSAHLIAEMFSNLEEEFRVWKGHYNRYVVRPLEYKLK